MKPYQILFLSLSFFCLNVGSTNAESISGTIDSVINGDQITIISKGKEVEVHLFGISAPAKTQAYGQAARNFTGSMLSGKEIRVEPVTKENGKIMALVFVNDVNLNEQIISQGFGWVYPQSCKQNFCTDWQKLGAAAKASRKGLWAGDNPTPPWEHRKNQWDGSEGKELKFASVPSVSAKTVSGGPVAYRGDTKNRVFHSAACKEFKCSQCTVNFTSITEALDAGYRPHRDCLTK